MQFSHSNSSYVDSVENDTDVMSLVLILLMIQNFNYRVSGQEARV